jgi:LmbE family N-acetylglucosaminyl deacetylase
MLVAPDVDTWTAAERHCASWVPPARTTVVLAPHPDDEVLGCGALIAYQRRRNLPVVVVAITDGEAAYPDQAPQHLGSCRRAEQLAGLSALDVQRGAVIRLGLPDGHLEHHERTLERMVLALIQSDDLVVAPWMHDHHCDHEAVGRAAARVCDRVGAALMSTVFWARQREAPPPTNALFRFDLNDDLLARRRAAVDCHQSQLTGGRAVLPSSLLTHMSQPWELYVASPGGLA